MFVGIDHGVYDSDALAQQLLSQVRSGIDQEVAIWQAKDGAGPSPLVLGSAANTDRTSTTDRWYTDACAGTQQDEMAGDIRGMNFFWHFAAVWRGF